MAYSSRLHPESARTTATDFRTVNRAALRALPALLWRWLPDGRRQGHEWVARTPKRDDRKPGSFNVNLNTGRWADFAEADARGGDVISLTAYLGGLTKTEDQGAMQPHDVKKNLHAATEAACAKLTELYTTEERGPGTFEVAAERLGVMVADYHHAKGSTDEIFQKGLTAALEAGTDAWAAQKNSPTEIEHKTMAVLDAGILHWFRLTGRKAAGA